MTAPYNTLTSGWGKKQILLRFDDVSPDTYGNYSFQLLDPLSNVMHAEWVSTNNLVNTCVFIRELDNEGQSSVDAPGGVDKADGATYFNFWRVISDNHNYMVGELPVALMTPPRNINILNVRVMNSDGSPFSMPAGSVLQLWMWVGPARSYN